MPQRIAERAFTGAMGGADEVHLRWIVRAEAMPSWRLPNSRYRAPRSRLRYVAYP